MGGGGVETVDTIPDWAKDYYERYLGRAEDLYLEGGMGKKDPLLDEAEGMLTNFARGQGTQVDQLEQRLTDMYNISQGADRTDTEALKNAATLRAKQEMVPTTQLYAGMGGMASNVGGGRQQLALDDSANRLAAQFVQFDYDAEEAAKAREDAARAGMGDAYKDYAGASTFGADILAEIGKTRGSWDYDALLKLRDSIDFRQPTQTAVSGGK